MAVCSVTAAWLVSIPDLELSDEGIELAGLSYTDESEVRELIGLPSGATQNIFLLRTQDMERSLSSLPAVATADVAALLPDRLVVDIKERSPLFVMRNPAGDHLLDVDGVVLDLLQRNGADALGMPVLDDGRESTAPVLEVGGRLQEPDLSAVRQLLAVTPEELGSTAESLTLTADDDQGFTIAARPTGWRAIFGHYTSTLRPPDMISRQVQCLRTLLVEGEASIATIYLAPLDDRCGTYLPRTTPSPRATPTPSG